MTESRTTILHGTLDLLILKALAAGELHALGVSRRAEQITQGTLRSLVFGISELDPVTFAGVATSFVLLGAAAGVAPALRAARIDPVKALRAE